MNDQTPPSDDRWPGYTPEAQAYEESTRPEPLWVRVHTVKGDPSTYQPSNVAIGVGRLDDGRMIEFGIEARYAYELAARLEVVGGVDCQIERWQILGIVGRSVPHHAGRECIRPDWHLHCAAECVQRDRVAWTPSETQR